MELKPDNPLLINLTPDQFVERMVREILERRKLGRRRGDKKLVCIKIPVRLRDALRQAALKHGVTMTEIVIWGLEQLLPILEAAAPIEWPPEYKEYLRKRRCGRPRTSSRTPYPFELRRKAITNK